MEAEGYWAVSVSIEIPGNPLQPASGSTVWPPKRGPNRGGHLRYLRRHPRHGGDPTGCMGLADYLGWDWKSRAGLPIVNVPGCPVQPDNFMETVLYLLYQTAGLAPMIPLDDQCR